MTVRWASNLNYVANQTVPNFVITARVPRRRRCASTPLPSSISSIDLAGYLPSTSPIVTLDQPLRIVDSREARVSPRR